MTWNTENIIDSRDVIDRLAELEADADRTEDEEAERKALKALDIAGDNYSSDWIHGETLIRDSYFVDYAIELAEDMYGHVTSPRSPSPWPYNFIDWEEAAGALQMDYSAIDFDGVTYWIHS